MEGLQSPFQWRFLFLLSAKTAWTGRDSQSWTLGVPLITHPPWSVQGLGTQVDPVKASRCFSPAGWDGLGWKTITTGQLTVPKRERSDQTWPEWFVVLASHLVASHLILSISPFQALSWEWASRTSTFSDEKNLLITKAPCADSSAGLDCVYFQLVSTGPFLTDHVI